MPVDWRGDELLKRIKKAQIFGINKTMSEAVIHAKSNHTWRNRTGTLEGSINIVTYGRETETGAEGVWGSQDVRYALIHELSGVITPKVADKLYITDDTGKIVATADRVEIPARPYLRPAAADAYPKLATNIQEGMGQ